MAIHGIQPRLREAGRIRIGEKAISAKSKKLYPKKLETFRFTSADQRAIEMLAEKYGGTPQKWDDAPAGEQWQVTTDTSVLGVLIPPVEFAFTQFYETWSAGGCSKRCDGAREVITDSPCLCDPDDRECKPHSRLGVILSDFSGVGLWRLETRGYYAASELAASVELLNFTQGTGSLTPARLMLEQRQVKRVTDGKPETFNFAVPALDLDFDLSMLMRGSSVREVESSQPALGAVVEAEHAHTTKAQDAISEKSEDQGSAPPWAKKLEDLALAISEPLELDAAAVLGSVVMLASGDRTALPRELDREQALAAHETLQKISNSGLLAVERYRATGDRFYTFTTADVDEIFDKEGHK